MITVTKPMTNPVVGQNILENIFSRFNMSDLPAMDEHVQRLKSLASNSKATLDDLVDILLLDLGLAVKTLKEANSAYYASRQQVASVSVAANTLGYETVRELVANIPVIEDFSGLGLEHEGVIDLVSRSFLSAIFARHICHEKKLHLNLEEVYLCTFLHQLNKVIVYIYLPDLYRDIIQQIENGRPEDEAAKSILQGYTFHQFGVEIARFWNFPDDTIIAAMDPAPPIPRGVNDQAGCLQNLACFCNRFVTAVIAGRNIHKLLDHYGEMFSLDKEEAQGILDESINQAKAASKTHRNALNRLKVQSKLRLLDKTAKAGSIRTTRSTPVHEFQDTDHLGSKRQTPHDSPTSTVAEETIARPKSINDYLKNLKKIMAGPLNAKLFVNTLLSGLHQGIGFDRAILAFLVMQPDDMYITGYFGIGDIDTDEIREFKHPLSDPGHAITSCIIRREDMALTTTDENQFPLTLKSVAVNRFLYLLPICLGPEPVGLLYLDRKNSRPPLSEGQLKDARLFRDITAKVLEKNLNLFLK